MSTPDPPAGLTDGLYTAVQADGRVRFVLARRRKAVGHVTLSPEQAGDVAANALGGAYNAHHDATMGLVPMTDRRTENSPFVRITGLGIGSCPIEGYACLVVKVGAAEIGFAVPKAKLKEFAQAAAASEILRQ